HGADEQDDGGAQPLPALHAAVERFHFWRRHFLRSVAGLHIRFGFRCRRLKFAQIATNGLLGIESDLSGVRPEIASSDQPAWKAAEVFCVDRAEDMNGNLGAFGNPRYRGALAFSRPPQFGPHHDNPRAELHIKKRSSSRLSSVEGSRLSGSRMPALPRYI